VFGMWPPVVRGLGNNILEEVELPWWWRQ
jgi:hypothetical protein